MDLSWLVAWGIVGPYYLIVTGPLSALLVVVVLLVRRRGRLVAP
jgi:hypothetical protein